MNRSSTAEIGYLSPAAGLAAGQPTGGEVVELPLLLPLWQAVALEKAARERGMTTAQMLRRLIGERLGAAAAAN